MGIEGARFEKGSKTPEARESRESREVAPDERTLRMRRISSLFSSFGGVLLGEGVVSEVEVYQKHDVHAFYRLASNPNEVIHVQGYPGGSTDTKTLVLTRVMDYEKMHAVRQRAQSQGFDLIGNEHEAVVRQDTQTQMEYKQNALSAILGLLAPEASISLARLRELGVEK